jgi:hypothetical protein
MELEQKSLSPRLFNYPVPFWRRRDLLNPEYNISKTALLLLYLGLLDLKILKSLLDH